MLRRKLSVLLHDQECPYNHTDGCAWWYEQDHADHWDRPTHKQWLARADEVLAVHPEITLADVDEVLDMLSEAHKQLRKWTRR